MNCTSETDARTSFSEKFPARPADRLATDDPVSEQQSVQNLARWIRAIRPRGFVRSRVIGERGKKGAVCTGSFVPEQYENLAKLLLQESRLRAEAPCIVPTQLHDRFLAFSTNQLNVCRPNNPAETDADVVDDDIVKIDCDPDRPANCCGTVEEKEAAWQVACEVADFLVAHEWPYPAVLDSGNGYHLYVRVGSKVLPVGEAYEEAKKRGRQPQKLLLDGLDAKLGTGAGRSVKIDPQVGNLSHAMRVTDTVNRKGRSTPERPHRKAQVVTYGDLEDTTKFVTAEQFAAVLADLPIPEEAKPKATPPNSGSAPTTRPDIEARAVAYLAKCDPAISGQGGHSQTLRVARGLVWGFNLEPEVAARLMLTHWNDRCQGPWDEEDIQRKCREATKTDYHKPRGYLLADDAAETAMPKPTRGDGQPPSSRLPEDVLRALSAPPEPTPETPRLLEPLPEPFFPSAQNPYRVGQWVTPSDRNNKGRITRIEGDSCWVHFTNPSTGAVRDVPFHWNDLTAAEADSLAGYLRRADAGPPPLWVPFPTDSLPEPCRSFVKETALALHADEAMIAVPMLAAMAGAIGASADIQAKRGWTEPSILWAAIVSPTGSKKSRAIKLIPAPFKEWEKSKEEDHNQRIKTWDHACKSAKQGGENQPDRPIKPRSFLDDSTIEKVGQMLTDHEHGLTLIKDELSTWFSSFVRYRSKGSDVDQWLSLYDGGAIRLDRKSQDNDGVWGDDTRLSIIGGIQPKILGKRLTPDDFEAGLVARCSS